MNDLTAAPTALSVPPAPASRAGILWRLVRLPLSTARLVRRRPIRALALLVLLAAVVIGAGFAWTAVAFRSRLTAAELDVSRGHNAAAARTLRFCRLIRPDDPRVLLLSARVARRSGAGTEAEGLLDRYWSLYGDDDQLVSERLYLQASRGEGEAARPLLEARARQGGPDATLAREALVTGMLYNFSWGEAEQQLDHWLADTPGDTTALLLRGKMQEQRLQTSAAANRYRQVLELDPDQDEARLRLTTLLLQFRQGDEVVPHLQYLRTRLPDHPEVAVQWARGLALQGRTEEARAALDDALRAHPDYPAALADRGKTAVADGDDRAAEDYFARAVHLDPGDLPTRHQYVLTLSRNGKTAEAATEQAAVRRLEADSERINALIQGPLQQTPTDPAIYHEIATIALRSGQPAEALRWLRSAIQVAPDYRPAHQTLATLYHQTGSPALAAKHRAIAHRLEATPDK